MKLLDRYVIRNFLQVYLYCIAGFISIWLIFDVSDNISTFLDERVSLLLVVRYYAAQIPQVLIILLPVSLLLSLLFALGRMSRANEIVSMLTAGISLPRLLMPLIGMGLLTVAASMVLNYSLAPHAELARKNFLSEAQARPSRYIQGQIFRNRTDLRTWFIQNFLPRGSTFNNIQVLQQDANDNIITNYVASRASYRTETKTWGLENVKVVHYDHAGNIVDEQIYPSLKIEHWSETPFRLGSANERAEFLACQNYGSICVSMQISPLRCWHRFAPICSTGLLCRGRAWLSCASQRRSRSAIRARAFCRRSPLLLFSSFTCTSWSTCFSCSASA